VTGAVIVLAGPSGVGKGTVVAKLKAQHPELWVSVSVTTRPPRPGEVDGRTYHFVSDREFDDLVAGDGLLEWAVVHRKARYGTPRRPVLDAVAEGRTCLLEVDLAGARQVRRTMPSAVSVFLAPPSWEALEARLRGRGTEDDEAVARRLATARHELAAADEFDHVVVNGELGATVAELVGLLGLGSGNHEPAPSVT
jgi:guanylate kinase